MSPTLSHAKVAGSNPVVDNFCSRGPESKKLASGAEVAAAVLHHTPLDGGAANGAGFASPMSNLEIEMGCAHLALGADVGIHAGAFAADGCPKNSADAIM